MAEKGYQDVICGVCNTLLLRLRLSDDLKGEVDIEAACRKCKTVNRRGFSSSVTLEAFGERTSKTSKAK